MNSNMMNRNSMGCINRGGMNQNQRDMGSNCHRHDMGGNNSCHSDHSCCDRSDNMPESNGCGRSGNMQMNNGCRRFGNMQMNNGCGRSNNMQMDNGCDRSNNMQMDNGCGCSDNMPGNNGCGCSSNTPENNGCNCSGNMPGNNGCNNLDEQQLMGMNQNQLLNYLNQVSFSMYDAVLFLDTHPTDREAIAYFNEMKHARKKALKIYQKKFAPLLLDGVDADCEWTWGMEPLPWENC